MSEALLCATGLEKRFGAVTALAGVDLEVARGETLAIVGPNGAGKSTLLRIMAGLAQASAGTCEVFVPGDRRAAIGYHGHNTLLYPDLTARENLIFAARLYGLPDPLDRANRLLEEEGLTHAARRRAGGFSRGMAQRLSIARARVHDPALLLLDEPYTGLDSRAADRLNSRLSGLAEAGHTLVLVTHDIVRAGALADVVVLLVAGRVQAELRDDALKPATLEARYLAVVDGAAA